MLCPPAGKKGNKQSKWIPVTTRVTHTHTRLPEGRRKTKVKANVHVCARKGQKNEDMTRGRDGAKVHVVEMKGEPSAQGQTMKPTSL